MLDALEDPVELWDTFFRVPRNVLGYCPRTLSGFASLERLDSIEESCASRLAGNCNQHRELGITAVSDNTYHGTVHCLTVLSNTVRSVVNPLLPVAIRNSVREISLDFELHISLICVSPT